MGRYTVQVNGTGTRVDRNCPKCGGKLAPGKWGVWCPKKCGWRNSDKSQWAKTERPAGFAPLATPSPEQADIFAATQVPTESSHMVINALAGTGKTTVITDQAYYYSRRGLTVLCLAFTKRDRTALEAKIPEHVAKVWTSNAAGLAILSAYCKHQSVRLDLKTSFPFDLLKARFQQDGLILGTGEWTPGARHMLSSTLSLVSKARTTLALSATGLNGLPTHPTDKDWGDLALRFGIEVKAENWPNVCQYASALFRELADLKVMLRYKQTDHDNCVFLPAYHNMTPPGRYDRVLVDECQDQSHANRTIAELYRKLSTGRIIAVGDEKQAIYAWRGADQYAITEMKTLMEKSGPVQSFPLTLCRRCPKAVIAEAQKLVPAIQALDHAPEGEVRHIADKDFLDELKAKRKGLVLCRANAPLISTCLKMLTAGIPAVLVRSNVIDEIITLVKNACDDEDYTTPVEKVISSTDSWRAERVSKLAAREGTEQQVQIVTDKAECVFALCQGDGIKTAQDVLNLIARMFPEGFTADPEKMVVLSTVHGAKGSEADTVYLYSPDNSETSNKGTLWDQIWSDATDRDNVLYVAITRVKAVLVYAGLPPTVTPFAVPGGDMPPQAIKCETPALPRRTARKAAPEKKTPLRAVKAAPKGKAKAK